MRVVLHPTTPNLVVWRGNISGSYYAKYGYDWLLKRYTFSSGESWAWIWKLDLLENVKFFLWQVGHQALPTRAFLRRRHISSNATCPQCGADTKDMTHIFWRCSEVSRVWRLLSTTMANPSCTDATILEWVRHQIPCSRGLVPIAL
uniref:Ribonuclease H protein At1g65750 family n=1 Tax=Cajanus cajan TaxID=3821 RepID=A0A151TBB0_CAJCA|nr:Putative ribonuclease H protein At1g65750 family [Cajanus cajan]